MSSKKGFTDTAEFFISGAEGHQEEKNTEKSHENIELEKVEQEAGKEKAPKNLKKINGYVIDPKYYKETKSQRVQILARPSTMQQIKKLAKKKKVSTNELINTILESYLESIKE